MPEPAAQHEPRAHPWRTRRSLGWTGLGLGIVALAVALLPDWVAPLYDPPSRPIGQQATELLGELKDRAAAAMGMETPEPPPPAAERRNPWRDPRIGLAALVLAFAALALATLGFARREDGRVVACAVALAAGAVASEHLLAAILILAFAMTAVVMATMAGGRGV